MIIKAKTWIIGVAVAVGAFFAAYLYGAGKQKSKDLAKAGQVVDQQLSKIKDTAKEVKDDVKNNPTSGPGSSLDELRRNWSND